TCKILFISELLASGIVTGINKILPSSSGGINSVPKLIIIGMLIQSAIKFIPIVVFLHFKQILIIGEYSFCKILFTGFFVSDLKFPFKKNKISTGTSVTAMNASINKIKVLVQANGENNFPSCPVKRKTGRNDATIMIVE